MQYKDVLCSIQYTADGKAVNSGTGDMSEKLEKQLVLVCD